MEENFAALVQQLIARGQAKVVANLSSEQANLPNVPENASQAIASGSSGLQELIQSGISEVNSNVEAGANQGFPINLFIGVGNSDTDSLTGSAEANSSTDFNIVFEASDRGFGKVNLVTKGETTPLFSIDVGGPVALSGSSNLFAGDNSSTGSDNTFGGSSLFGGGNTFGGGMLA